VRSYEELKSELLEISEIVNKYPEDVKKQVFELLVSKFLGEDLSIQEPIIVEPATKVARKKKAVKKAAPKTKSAAKKKGSKESYKIDRHLDLTESSDSPSFKDFYNEKSPSSTAEFNAIAVYYLIKLKGHDSVSLDKAYTCYSEVKKKPADHFKQSFRDTQNKQGYIEFNDDGDLVIPHRGVVFVEHDLPKPKKEK